MRGVLVHRILQMWTAAKNRAFGVNFGPNSCFKGPSMFKPNPPLWPVNRQQEMDEDTDSFWNVKFWGGPSGTED